MTLTNAAAEFPRTEPGIEPFLGVVEEESGLLDAVAEALVRQRAAVASSDAAELDASVGALDRLLDTLRIVREQRERMARRLGMLEGETLDQLGLRFGGAAAAPCAALHARLRRSARAAAREASINRRVLRRALDSGEAFLAELFGGGAPSAYTGDAAPRRAARAGVLMDRRV